MMDITEIILNFQKLLASIANSLAVIGLYKGSDEWDELTEDAFRALVVNHLAERFDLSISHQYEMWAQTNTSNGIRLQDLVGNGDCTNKYNLPRAAWRVI